MDDTLTLGAARAAYYERNGFGADGGDALDVGAGQGARR